MQTWIIALLSVVLYAHAARAQGTTDAGPGQGPVAPIDPEYATLARSYNDALKEYHQQRLELSRGGKIPPPMEHPARSFAPRFRPLSDRGYGLAQVWMFQNAPLYIDDKGVIRFQNLRDEALSQAVDRLLSEMKARPANR